jgi:hypothetical protein
MAIEIVTVVITRHRCTISLPGADNGKEIKEVWGVNNQGLPIIEEGNIEDEPAIPEGVFDELVPLRDSALLIMEQLNKGED